MRKITRLILNLLLPLLVIGATLELLARNDAQIYRWLNGKDRIPISSETGYYDKYKFFHYYPYSARNGQRKNNLGFYDYEDYQLTKAPEEIRIIVLGNSIAAGTADEGTPWPILLREELRRRHPLIPISLMNAALPSSTEQAIVDYFEGELLAYQPDIVILNTRPNHNYLDRNCRPLGNQNSFKTFQRSSAFVNRFYNHQPADLEQRLLLQRLRNLVVAQKDPVTQAEITNYSNLIKQLIDLTQSRDIDLILSTMSFRKLSDSTDFREGAAKALYYSPCHSPAKLLDAYQATNDLLRNLAATNEKVELFDIERLLNGEDRYFVPADILHHTSLGNAVTVEQLAPLIDSQILTIPE